MKRLIAIALLMTGSLWAQSTLEVPSKPARPNPPSTNQQYCAGFISRHEISRQNHIVASKDAPHEDQFGSHSAIFIAGPALQESGRYSILRETKDPNHEDYAPEQSRRLARLGRQYAEIGWVTVHAVHGGISVATFDFACDAAVPGDIVVPFEAKPEIPVREEDGPVNLFRPSQGLTGHILGSKDSVGLLGTGSVVYVDYGSNRGAKVGEYLLIRRGYAVDDLNRIDRVSDELPRGDAPEAASPVKVTPGDQKKMPPQVLGELLLMDVRETASTGLIMRSFSEVQLGDGVETETANAAGAAPEQHVAPCTDSLWRRALFLGHKCK